MAALQEEEIRILLAQKLKPNRFRHSLGVADTAEQLAIQYSESKVKARLAGLLHDYARDLSTKKLNQLANEAGLPRNPVDQLVPGLLHGPVAAYLLPRELGIKDPEILQAIAGHTLGAVNMSVLDKIIYLADLIEPNRVYPQVEKLREITRKNLDQGVLAGMNQTIQFCLQQNDYLHPQTIQARNSLLYAQKAQKSG